MIRKANEKDIKFLMDIYNDAILNTTASFDLEPKTLEDRTKWFEEHNEIHPILIYEQDGKPVGYVSLSTYRARKAYDNSVELSVYIDKRYRGLGIGKKLVKAIIDHAKNTSEIHTVISLITGENEISKKLHENLGFSYCGTVKEVGYKFSKYLDVVTYQIIV